MASVIQRVGLFGENPKILHAIALRAIEKYPKPGLHTYPDFAVYSRKLKQHDAGLSIAEGTKTLETVGVSLALYPEGKIPSDVNTNTIALVGAGNALPPITSLEDKEGIELWADAMLQLTESKKPKNIILLPAMGLDKALREEATRSDRHDNKGFAGIQGGLGAKSGLEAFERMTDKYDIATMLLSVSRMPDLFEGLFEYRANGMRHTDKSLAVYGALQHTREMLEALDTDGILIACNTTHALLNKSVSLLEEGVAAIPNGATVIVVGSTVTAEFELYQREARRQGRDDIKWIVTNQHQQALAQLGIIEGLNTDDFQLGDVILERLLIKQLGGIGTTLKSDGSGHGKAYGEEPFSTLQNLGRNVFVLACCSEVIQAMEGKIPAEHIIEPVWQAIDRVGEIGSAAAARRDAQVMVGGVVIARGEYDKDTRIV